MIKLYNLTLLLIFLLSLCCCQQKTQLVITPVKKDFLAGDTLRKLVVFNHFFARYPQPIQVVDDYIVIENPTDCGNLTMFNLKTKESLSYWFKKATPSHTYSKDASYQGKIALYGSITNIFYEYNIDKGIISFDKATNMSDVDNTPRKVCRLTDSKFVGIGNLRQGLLAVYDKKIKGITFAGKYPLDEYMPPSEYQYDLLQAYRGFLAVSKDKKQVVYACEALGYIACYKYEKDKLSFMWKKQLTENKYKRTIHRLDFEPDHQKGFKDVKVINNHIYALYSGDYFGSPENVTVPVRNKVIVYNLDGVLLAEYLLPDQLIYFDVDKSEKYLYGTSISYGKDDLGSLLMRYPLDDLADKKQ